jgi:hypothetical protein
MARLVVQAQATWLVRLAMAERTYIWKRNSQLITITGKIALTVVVATLRGEVVAARLSLGNNLLTNSNNAEPTSLKSASLK